MKTYVLAFLGISIFSVRLHAQASDFETSDFRKADSIAALYPKHSLKDLKTLADKLTMSLSREEEKFRAIYTWVCNNIENDYRLYTENKRQREKLKDPKELSAWNKKFGLRVFKTLLNEQKTVCSGYAYLVKELSSHAGLSCAVINGYGRTVQANIRGSGTANHTWNAIQLYGNWYLCDATWSSGAIDPLQAKFIKKYDDSYFLAEPALFIRSHYPIDTTWTLLANKSTLSEFLNGPLIYVSAFRYKINPMFPLTFDVAATKGQPVSFRFKRNSDKELEKVELQINRTGSLNSVVPQIYQGVNGLYCLDHTFTTKGTHVVHVLFNAAYTFTYTVNVK